MKTIQQWTTELTERGITNLDVQTEQGRHGVVQHSLTWFETEPDDQSVTTVCFHSVERGRIDTRHFGVYAVAEAGGATVHCVYEFYGAWAAAASKLREDIIQEMLRQPQALHRTRSR